MSVLRSLLMRAFGRPRGMLGHLGGIIMAHTNDDCGVWVAELLEIAANDTVLEVGFGPGAVIRHLARLASAGHVAGIDPSREMLWQARLRNAAAIRGGRVELRQGVAARQPFKDNTFDKVLAINSMQLWPDVLAGLLELRRVMKPAARLALGFTLYSGQTRQGLTEQLAAAGFSRPSLVEKDKWFCVSATRQ